MLRVLRALLWLFTVAVLRLRYRITVHGREKLRGLKGPVLVLPNHVALIDPPIMLSLLYPSLNPRPLLFEGNFKGAMAVIPWLLNALKVPDLAQASTEARRRTEAAIDGIKDALRNGENVILWPSGRIQRAGTEALGAARTLGDVLQAVPDVTLLLVRQRGLWGSTFGYGYTGKAPSFGSSLLSGIGVVLSNLIFFTPRRKVDVTLEVVKPSDLPGTSREKLNPWLEAWYNKDAGPEKPTFVPYHFLFGPRTYEFPAYESEGEVDLSSLKPDVKKAVDELLAERLRGPAPAGGLKAESSLEDLGLDSLERMEISIDIERRFGFTAGKVPATVGELYALASGLSKREPPKPAPPEWFRPPSSEKADFLGSTIAEAFVNRALSCSKDVACADDLSGALTYERLLVGALTMSRHFRTIAAKNVGVLLPSSVACDVVLLGLYLADKLPVVLNWTTGPGNLAHAATLMQLTHVITSKTFTDRTGIHIKGVEEVHLEALRGKVGKLRLLLTLLRVRFLGGTVRSSLPKVDPDAAAVVLFTSGSEKAPKAVPLTHKNLITNQAGGVEMLKVTRRDSILGFLPAFHSFGMSITGLLPLLSGIRVVRHPDPTDAAALARKVGSYKTTVLVGTPTFVSYILERAEPGELASTRVVVVGAEKCPKHVFDRMKEAAPEAEVQEGYGITECSPVVAVNPRGAERPGTIGKALPGVSLMVVDVDTGEPVADGKMGMLLVGGPSVFPGYVGAENPPPFRELDGKRWYVTGDLVTMDADGYVSFSGRLKRFIKIGGEMVSLPALEEPLAKAYPIRDDKEGPRVAVEGVELDGGGGKVVLFTTEDIDARKANELISAAGMHGVMRVHEVKRVEKIPTLGSGKTDYKVLRGMIA